MTHVLQTATLTHHGALAMITAAVAQAEAMEQPQCIVIVDGSGQLLAELRMTGARFLSRKSALAKALTAASTGKPSGDIAEAVRTPLGLATQGSVTGLQGGLPIRVDGVLLGGIGVGSGSGAQDTEVAMAALNAIGATP